MNLLLQVSTFLTIDGWGRQRGLAPPYSVLWLVALGWLATVAVLGERWAGGDWAGWLWVLALAGLIFARARAKHRATTWCCPQCQQVNPNATLHCSRCEAGLLG